MSTNKRRPFAAMLGLLVGAGSLICLLVAGCSHKEEPPPKGSSYYTGPMAPKGSGGPKGGAKAPGD
jgi:hypothetical protein